MDWGYFDPHKPVPTNYRRDQMPVMRVCHSFAERHHYYLISLLSLGINIADGGIIRGTLGT